MATNKFESEIAKVFNNDWSNKRNISEEQLKTLKEYCDFYSNKKSSKGGIIKISSVWNALFTLRELGIYLNKPYEAAKKEDIINFFTKHNKDKSEATKSNWKVIIRSFYKWKHNIRKKHEFPEVVDDERLEPTRAKPRKVSPSDLFNKDDILKMLEVCRSPMDKSIVSIWFEMGLRAKEYVSANVGSVEFVSGGCKFYVEESKTETGFVPLIQSAPYLQEWLNIHPYKDDPKAPLFIGLNKYFGKRLQPNGINQKLKRICMKAGIKKRIFTHLGRNISITRLDGTLSVEDNARLHGITPATILNVYTRRTRKEAVKKYFDIYGEEKTDEEKISEKEEKDKLLPKKCENCGTINSFDKNYCGKCLRPIDIKTFLELENKRDVKDAVVSKSVDKYKPISKELVLEVVRELKEKEGIKELIKEMIRQGKV
ncbi:tyrosine-type recombinase/integrase [Candidatus Woesearchaeota archaeon]|nr:tyrosine-type recombinase/integrase [Candidatus Woesearchaeota archaeon]